jgi:hypothetical protein
MQPQEESGDNASRPARHQFPPGLEFLSALRKAEELEGEARMALLWTFLENVRDFSERLRQHGLDPDKIINGLQPQLEALGKAEKEVEQEQDRLLHATADVAEARRNAVDALEVAVNAAAEERPFDPQVQEWKEILEELRKNCPKID